MRLKTGGVEGWQSCCQALKLHLAVMPERGAGVISDGDCGGPSVVREEFLHGAPSGCGSCGIVASVPEADLDRPRVAVSCEELVDVLEEEAAVLHGEVLEANAPVVFWLARRCPDHLTTPLRYTWLPLSRTCLCGGGRA